MGAQIRSRSRSSSAPFPGLPLLLSISMASSSGTRRQADVSCGSTRRILTPFYFFHQPRDTTALTGFDSDSGMTMLRIGSMNLMLHGIAAPNFRYTDTLSKAFAEERAY